MTVSTVLVQNVPKFVQIYSTGMVILEVILSPIVFCDQRETAGRVWDALPAAGGRGRYKTLSVDG